MCGSDICLGILAILFPPLPVWVKRGICSVDSLINIALCCLGFLPGLLHAWYIIAVYPDPTYEQVGQEDAESGRVTYYYVEQGGQAPRSYGTVGSSSAPEQQFPGQQQGGVPQGGQYRQEGGGMRVQGEGAVGNEVPPSYAEVVKGDHKVQSRE